MIYPKHDTRMIDYRKEENLLAINVAAVTVDLLEVTLERTAKAGDHFDVAFLLEAVGGVAGAALVVTPLAGPGVTFTFIEPNQYLASVNAGKTLTVAGWFRGLLVDGPGPINFKVQGVCTSGDCDLLANTCSIYAWQWRP